MLINGEKLLLSESGLISDERSFSEWHMRGNRPSNFPVKRIRQFAHWIEYIVRLNMSIPEPVSSIIETVNQCVEEFNQKSQIRMTGSFRDHLLINAVAPYLWFLGEEYQDELFQDRAIELLSNLPAEKNGIISKWKHIGREPQNAFESQGMISLYKDYCCRKKCLSCEVGNRILNRS